jgi:hypothetical protein
MSAGGNLGNHAAEAGVEISLGCDDIGENVRFVGKNGRCCFVAGSFDGKEKHKTSRAKTPRRKQEYVS